MSNDKTGIAWTDATWGPVRGCSRVSPGCVNCYAERQAIRMSGAGGAYEGLVRTSKHGPTWTGKVRLVPELLDQPLRWTKPRRVFVNSMSDLFHEGLTNGEIAAVFGVMAASPRHTFQVLTKRARRMREWFETPGIREQVETFMYVARAGRIEEYFAPEREAPIAGWPGYFITSKGRVLSDHKGPRREMKPMPGEQGHSRVMLYRRSAASSQTDVETARPLIHRLVLEAFDRGAKDADEQGCHINGDATNNALWNLRWGSQSDNWRDRKRHGNGRSYAKLTPLGVETMREEHASGISVADLAHRYDVSDTQVRNVIERRQWADAERMPWPLPSVWLGVSAEDQQRADERIPDLLATPAAVRFVSYEPALGPVDFFSWLPTSQRPGRVEQMIEGLTLHSVIDWVIVGGESGPGARPFEIEWLQQVHKQTASAGVALFVKQDSGRTSGLQGRIPDAIWKRKEFPG